MDSVSYMELLEKLYRRGKIEIDEETLEIRSNRDSSGSEHDDRNWGITRQCPHCNLYFKNQGGRGEDYIECPFCFREI
jgi:hypothetical protein